MAEVKRMRTKQMGGAAIESILNPSKGLRDEITRRGGVPKDHKRENYMRLKQVQAQNKIKQEAAARPQPAPFKLKQFTDVPSKLATQRCNSLESMGVLSSALEYLVDGDGSRPTTRPSTGSSRHSGTSSGGRSFIAVNVAAASHASTRTHPTPPSRDLKRSTPAGQVPKYLLDRKMAWAKREEQRLAALEADKIPQGMMLISETERLDTLRFLQEVRDGLISDLSRFPVIVETPSMKRKRAAIETKLNEVDTALDHFGKKVVYVEKEWTGIESFGGVGGVARAAG
ncbi:hypothetical protein SmJEL517_g00604 [Synchytrium microbalum]|uniref:Enkurin domain-containing protein n=1 Tax=Synchytrium microbalum TaxID=1806994 RepID=A0A507CHY1_9FUNG|nr:uncharacterized protein SmJEL517_g00604 [Synchytrium microbalum]TPX37746.1 hypothetical protein SmJEL517_g00604 [Synchytrium microbalum]